MPNILTKKYGEFTATNSKAFFLTTKNLSTIFYCILKIFIKFWIFWKKKIDPHSLNIYEIIHSEKGNYLNAEQVLFQNVLGQQTCEWVSNTAGLNEGTFILIFHYSGLDRARKRPFLLTNWLSIPSMLSVIRVIYRNQFKCIYLKNQNLVLNIYCIFRTYIKFWAF